MNNVKDSNKCIKCNKCLPCAADINIPIVLSFKDDFSKIDSNNKSELDKFLHNEKLVLAMNNAAYCIRCNKCIRCCPSNIDIPLEIIFNLSNYKYILKNNHDSL